MAKLHRKCKAGEKWHEDNHICRIIVGGDLDKVKKLVNKPKFICKNCGRAANASTSICRSTKL